ncbi:MAG: CPBP family intramembrane metalloprotease [Anaerolineales bacterium]|nr:CPBP family intramembrane metalloprotease [Anaerolineales bacterium]
MDLALAIIMGLGIVILVNIATKNVSWKPFIDAFWAFVALMLAFLGIFLILASMIGIPWPEDSAPSPIVGVLLVIPSLLILFSLLPIFRRRLSLLFPLDPESPVHLTALFLSYYLLFWSVINLTWWGGIEGLQKIADVVPIYQYVLQSFGFVAFAFVGVGFLVRRGWRQSLERLGLADLRWIQVFFAFMSIVIMMAINITISALWSWLAPEQIEEISDISQLLLGAFDSLPLIFLLSVLSGFGEEILFRGALQPRLGLVFTAILFASTHIQYSISPATLVVLGIGLVLGLLRRYFGTWTAIFAHFGYNFGLLLLGLVMEKILEL